MTVPAAVANHQEPALLGETGAVTDTVPRYLKRAMQNRFDCLALHEEIEPKQVARLTSKRAQKKLQRKLSPSRSLPNGLGGAPCSDKHNNSRSHQGRSTGAAGSGWVHGSEEEDLIAAIAASLEECYIPDNQPVELPTEVLLDAQLTSAQLTIPQSALTTANTPVAKLFAQQPELESSGYRDELPAKPSKPRPLPAKVPARSRTALPEEDFPALPAPSPPPKQDPMRRAHTAPTPSTPPPAYTQSQTSVKVVVPPPPRSAEAEALPRLSGLDLYWDLVMDGMIPLSGDVLHDGLLDERGEETKAAVLAAVEARLAEEGTEVAGVSMERMLDMMRKTAQKASGGAAGEGEEGLPKFDSKAASKEWRLQVNAMRAAGWMAVPGCNKHIKFRRLLPNGHTQTITVPSSPSDVRAINHVQARAARQDREAADMIAAAAAAAAAATPQSTPRTRTSSPPPPEDAQEAGKASGQEGSSGIARGATRRDRAAAGGAPNRRPTH